MRILFVGSNPSPKNTDFTIPFLGTRSAETLGRWTEELEFDTFTIVNASDKVTVKSSEIKTKDLNLERLKSMSHLFDAFIALGTVASKALTLAGIEHHSLPHPSGRNRLLNDKTLIAKKLAGIKSAIKKKRG